MVLVVSHFSSKHSHVHELEQAMCANLMNHHVAKVSECLFVYPCGITILVLVHGREIQIDVTCLIPFAKIS